MSRLKEIKARVMQDIRNLWMAAAAIAVYTVVVNLVFHAFCPMVIVTGFPCPGCGMTRALWYLATGRVGLSVQMHPMGIPAACIFLYFLWNRYVLGRDAKGIRLLIGAFLILLLVLYVWRMYLYFPDRIPYVYVEKNMLSNFFPFYKQVLHELKIM